MSIPCIYMLSVVCLMFIFCRMLIVMLSVVYLKSVPCNLYILCSLLCATFTLIIVVFHMHVPLLV